MVTQPIREGSSLKMLQKEGLSRARKPRYPMKYPIVCPTVLHVLAHPIFRLDSIVRAQLGERRSLWREGFWVSKG